MNRRESLLALSTLAGHALFSHVLDRAALASAALAQRSDAWQPVVLSGRQGRILAEVVETIVPQTDSPGAKAARVHVFVDLMLAHCVAAPEREAVLKSLDSIGEDFLTVGESARQARLAQLDVKVLALIRELTILGYFTSEVGATRALAYEAVPGEYRGCIDLQPGQRAWATR